MVNRTYWQNSIEETWRHRSVIWLSGVRRAGKTHLCRSIPDVTYFDCELPSVREQLADPEWFLSQNKNRRIVLDEIQRLPNPSEILKIAADHYPTTKIIATGSSILGASTKFADTLTGRKSEIWLTPLLIEEGKNFGHLDLSRRMLYGGLPPFFISKDLPNKDYQEWIDAYWAKDIQELFRLEKKHSFQKFTELMLAKSGGIFEATAFAKSCEVSRGTISNYLSVLESTYIAHIIRPFHTHKSTEIVAAPKVYGFDTGFVCYHRGWESLRKEDIGLLWEHIVLNEIQGRLQTRKIHNWRDKQGHEIDFVLLNQRNKMPTLIECKSTSKNIDLSSLTYFRKNYPQGKNFIVTPDTPHHFQKRFQNIIVDIVNLTELISLITK